MGWLFDLFSHKEKKEWVQPIYDGDWKQIWEYDPDETIVRSITHESIYNTKRFEQMKKRRQKHGFSAQEKILLACYFIKSQEITYSFFQKWESYFVGYKANTRARELVNMWHLEIAWKKKNWQVIIKITKQWERFVEKFILE